MAISLITGIFGMDAQNLARILLSQGHNVIGTYRYNSVPLDNRTTSLLFSHPNLTLICTDLTDSSGISQLIAEHQPDFIFNLAAMSHVGQSFTNPNLTFNVDTGGVLNLLEGVRQHSPHSRIYQACHDRRTRIMTPAGPKQYSQIKAGDLIFTLNERREVELKPVLNVFTYDYCGKMTCISGQKVTPNHTLLFEKKDGSLMRMTAEDAAQNPPLLPFPSSQIETRVPPPNITLYYKEREYTLRVMAGGEISPNNPFKFNKMGKPTRLRFTPITFALEDLMYLAGALISDTLLNRKMISVAAPKNTPLYTNLTSILNKYKLEYAERAGNIFIYNRHIVNLLRVGRDKKKLIPSRLIKLLVEHKIVGEHLWRGLIDSTPHHVNFITSNFKLAQQVVAVAYCIGKNAKITKDITYNVKGEEVTRYVVVETKSYPVRIARTVDYKGRVWCVEVENHNFLVSRRGRLMFSGNSTSEMFGKNFERGEDGLPIQTINTPLKPSSPYGIAKLAAHHLIRVYREGYGIFAVSGILFNHTDKNRTPTFFERKVSIYGGKLARWIKDNPDFTIEKDRLKSARSEFPKLPLGVIEGVYRDIGWSTDYMRAALLMLEQDYPNDYVVATGESYPITEILRLIIGNNYKNFIYEDPQLVRPVDVPYLRGDSNPIRELGWSPTKTFDELILMLQRNDRGFIGEK